MKQQEEVIVLIGMAGVGKSTIGFALAKELGFRFTDLDEYIYEKDGQTVQQVIDTDGEEALIRLEKKRILELDLNQCVVAPGGSIIYDDGLMDYLKANACLVYLKDTLGNIRRRLIDINIRGIVGLKKKSLRQVFEERRPLYSNYASIIVDVEGKSREQVVSEIVRRFRHETT